MEKANSDSAPLYDNTIFVNGYLLLHTQEYIMVILEQKKKKNRTQM